MDGFRFSRRDAFGMVGVHSNQGWVLNKGISGRQTMNIVMNLVTRTVKIAFVAILCGHPVTTRAQDTSTAANALRLVADAVLRDGLFRFVDTTGQTYNTTAEAPPGARLRLESPYADWRYWNGVLNLAMLRLADVLHHPGYEEFVTKNISFAFDNAEYFKARYHGEGKWNYPFGQYFMMEELDDCGAMGAGVVEVQRRTPQPRLQDYLRQASDHILKKQTRLMDGTLVRSFPHEWTLWADDLYMSVVFLARMGETTRDRRYFDDAALQVEKFHHYLFDSSRGLMHHCWYSDVDRPGVAFWGRANGWAMVAQVELLDRLPAEHPQRARLLALLRRHILGVAQYQSGEGLWHQLIDKTDSYLETSCTAMFTYAIARAVNRGYIEPRYGTIARHGWAGILSRIRSDGQIEGICAGTGIEDDLVHYYRRPTPLNDPHGIGAVILAGAEILALKQ
jgi:unsaturated rhamnogalacturonyl hydrolase